MALWGELPRRNYLPKSAVKFYLRNLQMELPLEHEVVIIPAVVYRDAFGRKVSEPTWSQQPRRHPRGPVERSEARRMGYQQWLAAYQSEWIRKRKAEGLPYEITNPAMPAKRRKTA